MTFDPQTIQMMVTIGAVIAFFGYQFFGKGADKAKIETAQTYKELNEALEKRVTAMEEDQKKDRIKIMDLEERVTKLTAEKINVENLVVRALRELFAANSEVASDLREKLQLK